MYIPSLDISFGSVYATIVTLGPLYIQAFIELHHRQEEWIENWTEGNLNVFSAQKKHWVLQ